MDEQHMGAAPPLQVELWFNTNAPIRLESLRGKVVVLYAFQMLCPGCVSHGLPQAKAIYEQFTRDEVEVIGLHSVFEHHAAMQPQSLAAFLYEYRVPFPVAVDRHEAGKPLPLTMQAYAMQGTPTLIIIDKQGMLRMQSFGPPSDLLLGRWLGRLLSEPDKSVDTAAAASALTTPDQSASAAACTPQSCPAPRKQD